MPQTPERKRQYARERRERMRDQLNAQNAQWRQRNRESVNARNTKRRREKRAMCLVAAARIRARNKCLPFNLSVEDIAHLQSVIDAGACELSGIRFELDGGRGPRSPSLDRIFPNRGYVSGNVRVVCHSLNAAMGDWGAKETLRIMRAFVEKC